MAWIQGVQDYVLNFKEEIVAYCRSDVATVDIIDSNTFEKLNKKVSLQKSSTKIYAHLALVQLANKISRFPEQSP